MIMEGCFASENMTNTKQKEILVPLEVTVGLVDVLRRASTNGQLKGKDRRLAVVFADVLEGSVATSEHKARVSVSIQVVADILRVILMIIKPDPIVKAVIMILGRGL